MEKRVRVGELSASYTLFEDKLEGRTSFSLLCELDDEAVLLPDVSSLRDDAERIFFLFVEGFVTPVSAAYVIEEILSGGAIY